MATRLHEIEQHDRQELCVAVAMDSGVSLAICMGGVTKEIDGAATADTRNSLICSASSRGWTSLE